MRPHRRHVLPVLALAALLTGAAPAMGASGARVWMTTGDQKNLLSEQPATALAPPAEGVPTITVDPSQRFQRIDGFGASITDSSAHLIAESRSRDAIMRDLFDPNRGIGLSYLRQPMGASDFVKGPHYTYDDLPAGKTDFGMTKFSVGHDEKQILPLLRQARGLNRNLKVMGTPWSPPAWMKTNQSLVGGRFIDDKRYYDAYTKYFVKFVQAYQRAGIPVDAVTLQNEPQNRFPSGYPGMDFRDPEEARLIKQVGPAFQKAGLDTKILGYDHNWSLHPNDVGQPGANPEYAKALLDDPGAKRWLAGTAFHCYYGDPSSQSELKQAHPDRDIYFTECSGLQSGDPATSFPDTLHWHTRYLTIGATRNWAKNVITWNLALDPQNGPFNGGCETCMGVVTVDPATGRAKREGDYYVMGHVTKFVKPGAVRIGSTVEGNIWDVAFRNPDGSTVVLVNNDDWGTGSQRFNLRMGSKAVSYDLPAGAVATFVLNGS
jgi:glucosylceramidase